MKEVFSARLDATDTCKYLVNLEKWFDRLNNTLNFPDITQLFTPILHIILLIWKNSMYYNNSARLVVLMREICNALIAQAVKYISGKQIFELIESEETAQAV